jgi:hypothetical protein
VLLEYQSNLFEVIFMASKKGSNTAKHSSENENGNSQSAPTRETKIMNTVVNTSVIIMSAMMDAFGEIMVQATGTMATGIADALVGEESGEEIKKEFEQQLPKVNETMKTMVCDIRNDIYGQFKQKENEILQFFSDPEFDAGPKIVEKYNFNLPKLTDELDDKTLAQYTLLLVSEEPLFTEMFNELTRWMNRMPKFPEKKEEQ